MKATKPACIILLLSVTLLMNGCWNSRELNDIAVVVGLGIDKVHETNKYQLTFQIIIPSNVAQESKGGGGGIQVVVYSETDSTLFGALRKASQKVPRQLFFAHIQQVIIGEALAKDGIGEIFDLFGRSHEIRLTSPILVTRGTDAETVLRITLPLEKNPSAGLAKRLELTNEIWAQNVNVTVKDVIEEMHGQGEAAISGVRIVGDSEMGKSKSNLEQTKLPSYFKIEGVALFKDQKLVKWLDGQEARGTLWIQNKMKGTVVNIACMDKKEGTSVELVRSQTKVKIDIDNGRPIFRISIDEEGVVNEVHCPIDLSKRKELIKIQKQWAEVTKKEVMEAVMVAQGKKSDIFGFGEEIRRTNPKVWKEMKGKWPEMFAEGKIEVQVEAYIRRTGMRKKPDL
jgi:spore germination protein KC